MPCADKMTPLAGPQQGAVNGPSGVRTGIPRCSLDGGSGQRRGLLQLFVNAEIYWGREGTVPGRPVDSATHHCPFLRSPLRSHFFISSLNTLTPLCVAGGGYWLRRGPQ